ncbi:MAG: hypothetical protein EBZ61_06610 [Micrococcales bacterium]|nr:hypothetical protein [Micrococcales bacterium]
MTVDLKQIVFSDAAQTVPFGNPDGTPSTVRDLYLQMFQVVHEDDNKATIAKKEELLRVYRKVLNSESDFTTEERAVLKDRAGKIFPSIALYSQICANLGE